MDDLARLDHSLLESTDRYMRLDDLLKRAHAHPALKIQERHLPTPPKILNSASSSSFPGGFFLASGAKTLPPRSNSGAAWDHDTGDGLSLGFVRSNGADLGLAPSQTRP